MVDITVQPALAASHVEDGFIALVRGGVVIGTVLLADISGNNWNAKRLEKLAVACQGLMDDRRLLSSLSLDDSDRPLSLTEFAAKYGGRMFIDGDSIVSRSDVISFTLVNGDVWPTVSVVR